MTHARARWLVGICGVVTVVLVTTVALALRWPAVFLPTTPEPIQNEAAVLLMVLLFYAALLAPFDVVGGHVIPVGFGRSSLPPHRFALNWLRGVAVQFAFLLPSALSLLIAGRAGGLAAAAAMFGLWMGLLLFAQASIARLVAGLQVASADLATTRARLTEQGVELPPITVLDGEDIGFTGGLVGLPGRERVLVPARWPSGLGDAGLAAELTRWACALQSGARWRGVAVAFGWNLVGFLLAALLPGADVISVAGLVNLLLAFTLWTFLGLLVLPSVSRPAVLATDAQAIAHGIDPGQLARAIERLDRVQDDERSRSEAVDAIFHPIPTPAERLARLDSAGAARSADPTPAAWHAARTALFLSWAGLGLLSRAAHCSSGRPELWVLLPCD